MGNYYLKQKLEHEIIRRGKDPGEFINSVVKEKLEEDEPSQKKKNAKARKESLA